MLCRFEDITQQLHDFHKATEQLKKHMSSASETAGFLDQSFASPQQQLVAAPADAGNWSIAAISGLAAESQPGASEAASGQMGREAEHKVAADGREAASLEALWGDARVQLQDGAVSGVPQQSSRELGALDEDELAEFSEETRALLRQIHAVSP